MYAIHPVTGSHLPPKTLCLTYDDGPGEHTLPIARFLWEQGIRATFFVVGKYAVERPAILAGLAEMGHLIGNHTFDHPDLPYYVSVNGTLQHQVLQTDAVIKKYTTYPVFFRAPYGKWSAETANELNVNLQCALNHIGPIHWDISGIDCYYWQTGKTVADTVTDYKKAIDEAGSGIIVMHDDTADMDIVKPLNQTLELTLQLIPILKAEGYHFIGLDEAMAVNPLYQTSLKLYLQTGAKKFISVEKDNILQITSNAPTEKTVFTIESVSDGRVLLKTHLGKYVCSTSENGIEANSTSPTTRSYFDLIPVFDNRFMLRTYSGHFININTQTGVLQATALYMRLATIFTYQPVQMQAKKSLTLNMQLRLWKKRLAFVKSKILSK